MPQEKPLAPMFAEEHALWRAIYVQNHKATGNQRENIAQGKHAATLATRAVRDLREQLRL